MKRARLAVLTAILLVAGIIFAVITGIRNYRNNGNTSGTSDKGSSYSSESPGGTGQTASEESSLSSPSSGSSSSQRSSTSGSSFSLSSSSSKSSSSGPSNMSAREMRGVWISTVINLDWPSNTGLSASVQKQEYASLLDSAKRMGMNAVMVQVRPMSDSFYPSSYFPWSQYLTGRQGGNPGYDPLRYMISEADKRGMKFYAWFNPFRVARSAQDYSNLSTNNPAVAHPEWIVTLNGGARWFNPGIPAVRDYVIDGICEVVRQYDIDGVILDDYFYPYPSSGNFDDDATFNAYGKGFGSKGDWRRNNINVFMKELHSSIKGIKSGVSFGASPFGIWRNRKDDSAGSATTGLSSYDSTYSDSRKWIADCSVDFIAPQIYWPMDYSIASYRVLVDWWAAQVKGTGVKLYIAQAAYKIGISSPAAWSNPGEYPSQIKYNRSVPQVGGSIHFRMRSLLDNKLGIADILKNDIYKNPAQP